MWVLYCYHMVAIMVAIIAIVVVCYGSHGQVPVPSPGLVQP